MEHQEMYLNDRTTYLIVHSTEMPAFLEAWNNFSMLNGTFYPGDKSEDLASFIAEPNPETPEGYLSVTIKTFDMMARTSSWLFHLGQLFEMINTRNHE